MRDDEGRRPGRGSGTSDGSRGIASDVRAGPDTEQQRTRRRLPNRRSCETISFEHGGANFTMSVGHYGDGRVGEIFINAAHANSALDAVASDAAIAISFAMQHGADLDAIKLAMKRNSQGEPSSPIGAALDKLT